MTRDEVKAIIREAGKKAGVDQAYLLAIAEQESGFDPNAKARTSSASGLFQFIRSTWLGMVKQYGKALGIGDGDVFNPRANAMMGALFTRDNMLYLKKKTGINPSLGDAYAAHFLGLGTALKMLSANQSANAVTGNEAAARANKSIFYKKDDTPRTVGEFRKFLGGLVESKVAKYRQ